MYRRTTNAELVAKYIDDVVTGRVVTGKYERAACLRHLQDLERGKERGIYFDETIADRACDFFPLLKHTTGQYAGKPFELIAFQRFVVWSLNGWRREADRMRRFAHAYISMGRGNGKSPFAAALLLSFFAFDCPLEIRAEAYTVATKRDQARIVFDEVRRYVNQEDNLRGMFQTLRSNINIPANGSKLEPLGSDSKNTDGLVPHVIVADELHAWQEKHRELWEKLTTAMHKRRQPLMITITTAGSEESQLWREEYDLACRVVDRDLPFDADDRFVYIAQIDDDDDPLDERVWPKANPMLAEGVVKLDALRSAAAAARVSPAKRNAFARYHGNRLTTSVAKLITPELWATGAGPLPDLDGMTGHAGFDWGWKDDIAALAMVFPLEHVDPPDVVESLAAPAVDDVHADDQPPPRKRRYAVRVWCWIPEHGPRDLTAEPWAGWIRDGWLRVTPGNSTDTQAIYDCVEHEVLEQYGVGSVAMDPNNCREAGAQMANRFGVETFWFGQTCGKYNEPTRELVEALKEGRLLHGDNPLLAWAATNLVVATDNRDYMMPAKKKAKDKIDPMVAMIMGLSECIFAEQAAASYYDENDLEIL